MKISELAVKEGRLRSAPPPLDRRARLPESETAYLGGNVERVTLFRPTQIVVLCYFNMADTDKTLGQLHTWFSRDYGDNSVSTVQLGKTVRTLCGAGLLHQRATKQPTGRPGPNLAQYVITEAGCAVLKTYSTLLAQLDRAEAEVTPRAKEMAVAGE